VNNIKSDLLKYGTVTAAFTVYEVNIIYLNTYIYIINFNKQLIWNKRIYFKFNQKSYEIIFNLGFSYLQKWCL
jgi:hypothetical protein